MSTSLIGRTAWVIILSEINRKKGHDGKVVSVCEGDLGVPHVLPTASLTGSIPEACICIFATLYLINEVGSFSRIRSKKQLKNLIHAMALPHSCQGDWTSHWGHGECRISLLHFQTLKFNSFPFCYIFHSFFFLRSHTPIPCPYSSHCIDYSIL